MSRKWSSFVFRNNNSHVTVDRIHSVRSPRVVVRAHVIHVDSSVLSGCLRLHVQQPELNVRWCTRKSYRRRIQSGNRFMHDMTFLESNRVHVVFALYNTTSETDNSGSNSSNSRSMEMILKCHYSNHLEVQREEQGKRCTPCKTFCALPWQCNSFAAAGQSTSTCCEVRVL